MVIGSGMFEFIRYSLDPEAEIPKGMGKIDWEEMFQFADEQGILGVVFQGVKDLMDNGKWIMDNERGKEDNGQWKMDNGKWKMEDDGHTESTESTERESGGPDYDLMLEWGFVAQEIENRNKKVNKAVVRLAEELKEKGFGCCILKGQGNNLLYPNVYSRTPGDIDVWAQPKLKMENGKWIIGQDVRRVIRFVKERNPEARAVYHHIDYGEYDDVEVEVHYRPSFMNDPIHNRRLQKWFEQKAPEQFAHVVELPDGVGEVAVPTVEFNLIFQLSHVYNHLLHEGIGLRQIIDYYYLLRQSNDKRQNNRLTDIYKRQSNDERQSNRLTEIDERQSNDKRQNNRLTEIDERQSNDERQNNRLTEIRETLRYLGLWKIAGAMMWVLNEVLGLEEKYLIAPKNEKLGRVLLAEMLRGGNFGQFDIDNIKADSQLKKNWQRIRRDLRMMRYFPSECLWEPVFRIGHFFWRTRNQ